MPKDAEVAGAGLSVRMRINVSCNKRKEKREDAYNGSTHRTCRPSCVSVPLSSAGDAVEGGVLAEERMGLGWGWRENGMPWWRGGCRRRLVLRTRVLEGGQDK